MVDKKDFVFDRENNFYRQMHIAHINKSDDYIINHMKEKMSTQLACTKTIQILENFEDGIKEVWAITPKSECL